MNKFRTLIFILLSVILCFVVFFCVDKKEINKGIAREKNSEELYIEDEKVPLAVNYVSDETKKIAYDCFVKLNNIRQSEGLKPLEWNNSLEEAASIRAEEIATVFSHDRPNKTPWYTVNDKIMYAENLAKGYNDADSCLNAWRKSATHNANLMDSELKTIGIYIFVKNDVYYWAQEFGY